MEVKMEKNKPKDLYEKTKNKMGYKGLYQLIIKRIIDIIICLVLLPFVIIILIPIAIAIKLDDNGPIFYHSNRIGVNFKEFKMLKFRSMKVDAPDIRNTDGSTFNSNSDSRVTRVGRFLRETSLDEIPQIFNIIKGNMSIIGPRPGDVESKSTYKNDEKDKLLIRPGITGYTQAYYRNNIGVRDKRLLDAYYAHNVSFLWDLRIFFKTISTVLKKENIYTN
jgi:undecaprenyl phosphate N,N'-diacetylbacillosamine 1-phosphate transferase